MKSDFVIRTATPRDAPSIAEIYNEAILHTTATFDTEPKSSEDREEWLKKHGERHPVFVAESDGKILGWASLSEWSDRCAYSNTAENSVYVRSLHQGKGIGKALMRALIDSARNAKLHTIVARIAGDSEASIRLHESFGFSRVGTMREVGFKFGRFHDVHLFQVIL